jgi:hypothetical protein
MRMLATARRRLDSRLAIATLTGLVLLAVLCMVVSSANSSGDYNVVGPVGGDNAGPGIEALLHGSVSGYIAHQPIVGLPSILLRLPFVAVASALGASALGTYQVGAVICLLPLILCGTWLVAQPDLSTKQRLVRFLAVVLVLQSPITLNALTAGHPEGLLSKTLATVAVLMAMRGRARWAALTLGLAISTKETALIAVLPVMIALPGRRREAAAVAGGVVFLLCGLVWLSDPDAFIRSLHGEGATRYLTPFSLLWPVSAPLHVGDQLSVARVMPANLTRTPASALTLLGALALTAPWLVRALRRGATIDPLALLLLMALLRCACDSTHEAYYWVTLLIPMATWEALRNRIPANTLLLSLSVLIIYASLGRIAPGYLYGATTGGEVLLALYLARKAVVPGAADRRQHDLWALSSSPARREPMPVLCDAPSTV